MPAVFAKEAAQTQWGQCCFFCCAVGQSILQNRAPAAQSKKLSDAKGLEGGSVFQETLPI